AVERSTGSVRTVREHSFFSPGKRHKRTCRKHPFPQVAETGNRLICLAYPAEKEPETTNPSGELGWGRGETGIRTGLGDRRGCSPLRVRIASPPSKPSDGHAHITPKIE